MHRTMTTLVLTSLCAFAVGCGSSSSDGSVTATQPVTPTSPQTASPHSGDYRTAATVDTQNQGGDSYSSQVLVAPPVPASRLPEVSRPLTSCAAPSLDQSRLILIPIQIRTTLKSSLPLKLALRISGYGSTAYVVKLNSENTCVSEISGLAVTVQVNPGAGHALQLWYPVLDAITPNHPEGDPEKLKNTVAQIGLTVRGGDIGTGKTYGPWVCDNSQIHLTSAAPQERGCGEHLSAETS
ncbi:hypothetical protein [Actinomadura rugatobispora]|uniref:DUF4232 domain-containing protein n=1 Tax=Actinomadura rugatobispora TaxID=1994 RepID=A0ABW1AJX5_9ACTN|nr:hypothetical protein GCM10010200_083070 [Actinomadura rugatobispora]